MRLKLNKTHLFFISVFALISAGIAIAFFYTTWLMGFPENNVIHPKFINERGEAASLLFQRFSGIQPGVYWFDATVSKEQLDELQNSGLTLVVNRITSDWYRVYVNGITIGSAGGPDRNRSNHWNDFRFFQIPPEIIRDTNRIELEIHATYALGGVDPPVFITTNKTAATLKTWFRFILSDIIILAQGVLIFSFLIYLLCLIVSPVGRSRVFFLISLSMLFFSIYLIEYIPFDSFFLPIFTTWKITESCLFTGAALIHLALWYHFRHTILLFFSIVLFLCIPSLLILFSGTILVFIKACEIQYWFIIAGFTGWVWVSIRNYKRSDFAKTLLFTTLLLMTLTVYDLTLLAIKSKPLLPMSVFGILTLAIMLIFLIATEYLKTLEHLSRVTVRADTYYRKSIRDSMTGLYNHDYVIEAMKRMTTHYAFILIDIDDFKTINDRYGHPAGDDVICFVAEAITRSTRFNDIAGRYGGDEFTVLLEGCPIEKAMEIASTIKKTAESFAHPKFDEDFRLSLSIGVSEKTPGADDYKTIISNADTALYRVKKSGKRNIFQFSEAR